MMERFINMGLIKEPMNWGIVFIVASIWLLAFHVVMTGFNAMRSGPGVPMGPGTGQARSPAVTSPAASMLGGAGSVWTDSYESKYAEDNGL
jgi:hypothetical protein